MLNGDLGVDLFFILSGFLIAYSLIKELKKDEGFDYNSFMINRWTRLIFVIIPRALWYYFLAEKENALKFWAAITFTANIFGHTELWSVGVEM